MFILRPKLLSIPIAVFLALVFSHRVSAQTTITASGDYGSDSNTSTVIKGIGMLNPDVHLALGDLSYGNNSDPSQESNWCNFINTNLASQGINTSTFPFQLVSGNHEDDGQENGFIDDFVACMPDRMTSTGAFGAHYYFDIDNVRVIMTSPDLTINGKTYTYNNGSSEYNDVDTWIDDARTAGQDWIIVGMHENCLTIGEKPACEVGTSLMNLLISKNVDVILHGHDHTYQRSKQLKIGTGCSSLVFSGYDADCAVGARPSNTYMKGMGPIDIVVATGGHGLYGISYNDSERNYFLRASGSTNSPSYGNVLLTIENNELNGKFVATKGAYSDEFVITDSNKILVNDFDKTSDLIGDFNGDGRDDVAYARVSGNTVTWRVGTSSGSSFNYRGVWNQDFGNSGDSFYVGDFNNDGRDDIAYSRVVNASTVIWRVSLSTGSAFYGSSIWKTDLGNDGDEFFVGDFTGDGRDDIAYVQVSGNTATWRLGSSTGSSFSYRGIWSQDMGDMGDEFYVGDFTGDNRDDITYMRPMSPNSISWRVGASTGSSFSYRGVWQSDMGDVDDMFKIGDINGDNRDDIIYVRTDALDMLSVRRTLSTGNSFQSSTVASADFGNDGYRYRVGDFDGNGRDDLAQTRSIAFDSLEWRVAYFSPSFNNLGVWAGDLGDSTDVF